MSDPAEADVQTRMRRSVRNAGLGLVDAVNSEITKLEPTRRALILKEPRIRRTEEELKALNGAVQGVNEQFSTIGASAARIEEMHDALSSAVQSLLGGPRAKPEEADTAPDAPTDT